MRHAVDVAELHDAVRQQPQRPLRMALGRLGAAQRHQARLERAVGFAQVAGTATLPTADCRLHTLLDKTLLDPIHLARTDAQDLGNGRPARPVLVELALVRVEQNQRVDHLLRLMRPLARDPRELGTLVLLQRHHVARHTPTSSPSLDDEKATMKHTTYHV